MHVFDPSRERRVNISDVTKTQLARAVNQQAEQIRSLDRNLKAVVAVLLAITQTPEALGYQDGHVTIERIAIDQVRKGTQLHLTNQGDRVVLSSTAPANVPRVETPTIIVPAGLH